MIKVSVYKTETGEITRKLNCSSMGEIFLNISDGEGFIEGDCKFGEVYVHLETGEVVQYPPKPGEWARYDYANHCWVDPRTTDDLANALSAAKVAGVERINGHTGSIRSKFITNANGQQMVYLAKEAEAKAWFTAGEPEDLTGFPWLQAEVGITAPTVYELAQLWLNLSAIWVQIGSQLETIRLTAIGQIEAQTNESGVQAVVSQALVQMQSLVPS